VTVTPLERLLIDSCLDVDVLAEAQRDLPGALARAGVSSSAAGLLATGHGYTISAVVRAARPQPSAAEIEAFANDRMAVDPIFTLRMRDEARPTLERAFQVRFPASRSISAESMPDGTVQIRVIDSAGLAEMPQDSADPGDIDVDIDLPPDQPDIDIDVDIVSEDIDADVVVDSHLRPGDVRWAAYWSQRRAHWASLQEMSAR
jgi:hypothetical protein